MRMAARGVRAAIFSSTGLIIVGLGELVRQAFRGTFQYPVFRKLIRCGSFVPKVSTSDAGTGSFVRPYHLHRSPTLMFRIVQRHIGLLAAVFVFLTTRAFTRRPLSWKNLTTRPRSLLTLPPFALHRRRTPNFMYPSPARHTPAVSKPQIFRSRPFCRLLTASVRRSTVHPTGPRTRSITSRPARTKRPTPGWPSSPITRSGWKSGTRFGCC